VSQAAESDPESGVALPPVFTREADAFLPSPYACSPWSAEQQHGAVMLGLLARAVERHPCDEPRQVTRLTVDMLRAAPMQPVQTHCRVIRTGRWVETLEASLTSGGEEYARASAMRFRLQELDTSSVRGSEQPGATRDPGEGWSLPLGIRFFARCVQMNPGDGAHGRMVWYRLRVPLVAGEPTSGVQLAAAMSDFAYGTPMVLRARSEPGFLPDRDFTQINPDTTVNLLRQPRGEWVGLESQLELGDVGVAVAVATLWDESGVIGSVTQSVLIRPAAGQSRVDWRSLRKSGAG
jgi:hypothetical protein